MFAFAAARGNVPRLTVFFVGFARQEGVAAFAAGVLQQIVRGDFTGADTALRRGAPPPAETLRRGNFYAPLFTLSLFCFFF